ARRRAGRRRQFAQRSENPVGDNPDGIHWSAKTVSGSVIGLTVALAVGLSLRAAGWAVLKEFWDLQFGQVLARRLAVVAEGFLLRLVHDLVADLAHEIEGRRHLDRKAVVVAPFHPLGFELRTIGCVLALKNSVLVLELLTARAQSCNLLAQFPNAAQR